MGKLKKSRELTDFEKGRLVTLCDEGKTQTEVAVELKCDQSTVSRVYKKWKKNKDVANLPRSGRKRKTTKSQDHYIKLLSLRDRKKSSLAISKELFDKEGRKLLHARSI